jgi:hypothetical protein
MMPLNNRIFTNLKSASTIVDALKYFIIPDGVQCVTTPLMIGRPWWLVARCSWLAESSTLFQDLALGLELFGWMMLHVLELRQPSGIVRLGAGECTIVITGRMLVYVAQLRVILALRLLFQAQLNARPSVQLEPMVW